MSELTVSQQMVVTFTYTIMDEHGEIQEKSDLPMTYIHGVDGKMFEKVEKALEGKRTGDQVEVTLSPEEGFGYIDPEMTFTEKLANIPEEYQHIGAEAMFQNDLGESITMIVSKIDGGMVTLDGNHPFAGKTMTFVVVVSDIRPATRDEISSGDSVDQNPINLH